MGFIAVERLTESGKDISFEETDKILAVETEEVLKKFLCVNCPFYKSDCDFVQQKEKSSPCGGFILLGHLLEKNIITIDNITCVINF